MANKPKDKLEKFVIDHRSEFDMEDPPAVIWEVVGKQIRIQSKPFLNWFWKAAAIIFFGISIYLSADKFTGSEPLAISNSSESLINEFQNVEQYYSQIINIKKAEIEGALDTNDPLNSDFRMDIAELDGMYSELQREYQKNTNKQIVDAMIKNLQIRIAILDKQLQIIQNLNNLKNNRNEGIKI